MRRAKIILNGQPWLIRFVPRLKHDWGRCYVEAREIVICSTTKRRGLDRETIVHEMLHALFPCLGEEAILRCGHKVDQALARKRHLPRPQVISDTIARWCPFLDEETVGFASLDIDKGLTALGYS